MESTSSNGDNPKQHKSSQLVWHLSLGIIKYCVPRTRDIFFGLLLIAALLSLSGELRIILHGKELLHLQSPDKAPQSRFLALS